MKTRKLASDVHSSQCDQLARSLGIKSHFSERHFTVSEVAAMWHLSPDTVRRVFKHEPGVVVLPNGNPNGKKRSYKTLRIPESVVAKVYAQINLSL